MSILCFLRIFYKYHIFSASGSCTYTSLYNSLMAYREHLMLMPDSPFASVSLHITQIYKLPWHLHMDFMTRLDWLCIIISHYQSSVIKTILSKFTRTILGYTFNHEVCNGEIMFQVINHQFNWWFDYSPHKGYVTARPTGRCHKHFYWSAIKRYYWHLLFSMLPLAL